MPKVSVIIPVYNVEKYLRECLDSVVNQTFKDIEIILVDDKSTDSSFAICQEYKQQDSRIKILQNEKNLNAGPCRNKGLVNATGEYVYFMDSDDFLELEAIEKIIKKLDENKDADFCVFEHFHYDNDTGLKEKRKPLSRFSEDEIKNGTSFEKAYSHFIYSAVVPWNKIYKREFLIKNNIFFDSLKCANDRSFYIETLVKSNKIVLLKENLINYRRNVKNSLISQRLQNFDCMFKSYYKVKSITQKENTEIKKEILDAVLIDIFGFYNKADEDSKKLIIKSLRKFLRKLRFPGGKKNYKKYKWFKQYKEIASVINWQNIFSIKNKGIHKVITVLGITIKTKSSKLQRKLEDIEKTTYYNERLNAIQKEFRYQLCKYMPEEKYPEYLKDWFYKCTGEELNLDNPQTFNEKIQWMKLYDSTPLKTRLADKYLVRDWVKEKIGEEYLIPLLGVWENFDDIDFDKLPDKFVLKTNHGSAWNIIVSDKSKFDLADAKQKLNQWLHTNFAYKAGLELHYKDIKPLIIAEKYLETEDNDLKDYKFLCFNGEVKYIWVDKDRYTNHKRNLFDPDWNLLKEKISEGHVYENWLPCPKPKNLDKMLKFAKLLSQNINFVRVDFYEHEDRLYFGEMTFTSASGLHIFSPSNLNLQLGQLIKLKKEEEGIKNA